MNIYMLICMRTTLVIDDELLSQAKIRAAHDRITLSELTTRALREALKPEPRPESNIPFRMPVFGDGPVIERNPAELAALRDE